MTKRGLLIVFSGPSGVGKDTLLRQFLGRRRDCVLSVSATTRPPRPGEAEGRDYFFISRERFEELAARGEMLEYADYGGNLYGTPREKIDRQLAAGKNVILEIETQGAMQIKRLCPDAVFVFVMPPDRDCLHRRLESRGTETPESLRQRLDCANAEMRGALDYDYILINDDLDRCVGDLDAVLTAAAYSARRMKDFVEEVSSHA